MAVAHPFPMCLACTSGAEDLVRPDPLACTSTSALQKDRPPDGAFRAAWLGRCRIGVVAREGTGRTWWLSHIHLPCAWHVLAVQKPCSAPIHRPAPRYRPSKSIGRQTARSELRGWGAAELVWSLVRALGGPGGCSTSIYHVLGMY